MFNRNVHFKKVILQSLACLQEGQQEGNIWNIVITAWWHRLWVDNPVVVAFIELWKMTPCILDLPTCLMYLHLHISKTPKSLVKGRSQMGPTGGPRKITQEKSMWENSRAHPGNYEPQGKADYATKRRQATSCLS